MSGGAFRTPYPGYDVLDKWDSPSFNDQTRRVVAQRLQDVPGRRFFTAEEWSLVDAVTARLIPQPDRAVPVPITPWLDAQLAEDRGEGYRHDGMPPMRDAWRRGLAGVAAEAQRRHQTAFAALSPDRQDDVLGAVQRGEVDAAGWRVPAPFFFSHVLLKAAVAIYYAHPAAWNEIGFGGPASPRGYVRMGPDRRDPWEAKERRRD